MNKLIDQLNPTNSKIGKKNRFISEEIPEIQRKLIYGGGCLFELTKWVNIFVIVVALMHFFVATVFIVDGESMMPNFKSGEYVIANRWQYVFDKPGRGDVVILKFPGDPDRKKYIKRIIGLPGETINIKEGVIYLNGKILDEPYIPKEFKTLPNTLKTMGPDEYFLMGDNRINSSDSRDWGVAPRRFLIGRAWLIFYPSIEKVKGEEYKV